MNKELHLFWGDNHIPVQDRWVQALVLDFIRRYEPGTIHLLGDFSDCYDVSKHLKDPARANQFDAELDEARSVLTEIRDLAPRAALEFSEGNHENRIPRFCRTHCPQLEKSVEYPKLMGMKDLRVNWHPATRPYKMGSLLVTHGNLIRKHSAYTAKCVLERFGTPVIHGHTHRMGSHYRTPINGKVQAAWENGCTCLIDPDLHPYTDLNWQQGFSVAQFRNSFFQMEQVLIHGRGPDAGYIFHGNWHGIPARLRTQPWPTSYMALEKGNLR